MIEGDTPYSGKPSPWGNIENFVFSPDNAEIWFNYRDTSRSGNFTTGKKLYIFAQKYLTELTADTTQGTIAAYTTAVVELTKTTGAWRLFLRVAKAEMFTLLAGTAANPDRDIHVQMKAEAWAEVEYFSAREGMGSMATTFGW